METELSPEASRIDAMTALPPGPLLTIGGERLRVEIAAVAGGRIAQVACDGVEQLVGHDHGTPAAIAWGSYPMVPWAGRVRRGRFEFRGAGYALPRNLGEHAIHGVGFVMPWRVEDRSASHVELSLALPADGRWPFGGSCRQRIEVDGARLRMRLSVTAGAQAMPATIGWHPWFLKPERIAFAPTAIYPRNGDAGPRPLRGTPPPGPWDDCFVCEGPVVLHLGGRPLRLTSDCDHWVVYDEPLHATCIEPQSGPNGLGSERTAVLGPGQSHSAWFMMEWL